MHSFKQQPCVDLQNLIMATLDVLKNGMVSVCIQQCPPSSMKCLSFLHNLNLKNKWKIVKNDGKDNFGP